MYVILNDELYHHGIKGQRWGVRRFQNEDGTRTAAGKKRHEKGQNGRTKDTTESKSKKTSNDESSNTKPKRKTKDILNDKIGDTESKKKGFKSLSPTQKKILIAIGATAALAITYKIASDKLNLNTVAKEVDRNKKNNPFDAVKKGPISISKEHDMSLVNSRFGKPGTTSNCTLCSTAYDMRRRGYDVKANRSNLGRSKTNVALFYKNTTAADFEDIRGNTKESFFSAFKSMPEGSRGNIFAEVGPFSSKHSMVWEKEKGQIVIRDCQANKIFKGDDIFYNPSTGKGMIRLGSSYNSFLRTDNLEIRPDRIMDAICPSDKKISLASNLPYTSNLTKAALTVTAAEIGSGTAQKIKNSYESRKLKNSDKKDDKDKSSNDK